MRDLKVVVVFGVVFVKPGGDGMFSALFNQVLAMSEK